MHRHFRMRWKKNNLMAINCSMFSLSNMILRGRAVGILYTWHLRISLDATKGQVRHYQRRGETKTTTRAGLTEQGGLGGTAPPPVFDRSVFPTSTGGGENYTSNITTCPLPPEFSDLPRALRGTGREKISDVKIMTSCTQGGTTHCTGFKIET